MASSMLVACFKKASTL